MTCTETGAVDERKRSWTRGGASWIQIHRQRASPQRVPSSTAPDAELSIAITGIIDVPGVGQEKKTPQVESASHNLASTSTSHLFHPLLSLPSSPVRYIRDQDKATFLTAATIVTSDGLQMGCVLAPACGTPPVLGRPPLRHSTIDTHTASYDPRKHLQRYP